MITVVVGLTMTAWAKKPPKPPGGGGDPVDTGTIYYAHEGSLWSMNPDGSGKTLLPVGGVPSMTRHPAEGDMYRWFLQVHAIPGDFYPIITFPPDHFLSWALDDLEAVGFTGDPNKDVAWNIMYYIHIDGEGNPDTFKWYVDFEGSRIEASGVGITGDYQDLHIDDTSYLTIKFDSTTGHALDDIWVIYVLKTHRRELFAVREDGLIEVQLTDDPNVQFGAPSWATHDGIVDGKVSYLGQRWGKDVEDKDVVVERGLFAVEIEWIDGTPYATTNPTVLPVTLPMSPDSFGIPYDWSPDGNWIVYSGDGIWVADANIEDEGTLLSGGSGPRWSPVLEDGSTLIAFRAGKEIRTISPGGGPTTTVVTAGKNRTIRGDTLYWSPNGTHLVYTQVHSKACRACQYNDSYDIYRVGADGSDPTNLTNDLQENAFTAGWRD
jgi:hypothetical protein